MNTNTDFNSNFPVHGTGSDNLNQPNNKTPPVTSHKVKAADEIGQKHLTGSETGSEVRKKISLNEFDPSSGESHSFSEDDLNNIASECRASRKSLEKTDVPTKKTSLDELKEKSEKLQTKIEKEENFIDKLREFALKRKDRKIQRQDLIEVGNRKKLLEKDKLELQNTNARISEMTRNAKIEESDEPEDFSEYLKDIEIEKDIENKLANKEKLNAPTESIASEEQDWTDAINDEFAANARINEMTTNAKIEEFDESEEDFSEYLKDIKDKEANKEKLNAPTESIASEEQDWTDAINDEFKANLAARKTAIQADKETAIASTENIESSERPEDQFIQTIREMGNQVVGDITSLWNALPSLFNSDNQPTIESKDPNGLVEVETNEKQDTILKGFNSFLEKFIEFDDKSLTSTSNEDEIAQSGGNLIKESVELKNLLTSSLEESESGESSTNVDMSPAPNTVIPDSRPPLREKDYSNQSRKPVSSRENSAVRAPEKPMQQTAPLEKTKTSTVIPEFESSLISNEDRQSLLEQPLKTTLSATTNSGSVVQNNDIPEKSFLEKIRAFPGQVSSYVDAVTAKRKELKAAEKETKAGSSTKEPKTLSQRIIKKDEIMRASIQKRAPALQNRSAFNQATKELADLQNNYDRKSRLWTTTLVNSENTLNKTVDQEDITAGQQSIEVMKQAHLQGRRKLLEGILEKELELDKLKGKKPQEDVVSDNSFAYERVKSKGTPDNIAELNNAIEYLSEVCADKPNDKYLSELLHYYKQIKTQMEPEV